ncbi:hypothetical protein Q5762_11990 [Streptomyces sp. P9(2023)]|uniref:hypothetical protein n=1 Tax=Streptomyces sp. P9(2023) TaxID=3064394 RepID=UPI0028F4294F|nr:hypothetical protein [Streptomyces sp. P9(2023)]MDT9689049.1 hypothetical protein [Streptomyces sp. P9(2023)]
MAGLHAGTAVGILVVATGVGLMALGAARQGRSVRPLAPARAWAADRRDHWRVLRRAAGMAIASARGAAGAGEPAIITVSDVLRLADEHFAHPNADPHLAAAALRHEYERYACARDCVTDAYG